MLEMRYVENMLSRQQVKPGDYVAEVNGMTGLKVAPRLVALSMPRLLVPGTYVGHDSSFQQLAESHKYIYHSYSLQRLLLLCITCTIIVITTTMISSNYDCYNSTSDNFLLFLFLPLCRPSWLGVLPGAFVANPGTEPFFTSEPCGQHG